jgi:hypothetical protein
MEQRVNQLLKAASLTGHDFRRAISDRSNMPTADSQGYAASKLKASQDAGKLTYRRAPTIQSLAPKMSTSKGSIPKIGADMSMTERLRTDPLIQYLQKEAEAAATNEEDMQVRTDHPAAMAEDPGPTDEMTKWVAENQEFLENLFSSRNFRGKYTQKDI